SGERYSRRRARVFSRAGHGARCQVAECRLQRHRRRLTWSVTRMRSRCICAIAGLVLLLGRGGAHAGDWGSWTAIWENDSFACPTGTDEYYTNGIRLAVARDPEANWQWAETLGQSIGKVTHVTVPDVSTSLVIGQNLYTPEVITTFDVNPLDRPYAAWLYGGVRTDVQGRDSGTTQALEFDLGLIGPPALGKQTQNGVHVLRHSRLPKGWDHQIPTEIAFNALYDVRSRFRFAKFGDVVAGGGLSLGMVQIYPTVGATLRLGHHISGMPIAIIAPSAKTAPAATRFEIYAFAGADGRAMLYNVFLDGNLIGGGPSVDSKPWVADFRVGMSMR